LSSGTGYIRLGIVISHAAATPQMRMNREPHIGEYDAKTNAFCGFSQIPVAPDEADNGPCGGNGRRRVLLLLPVVFEHLIAGCGQLGTMFLKAGQNGEVALIDHRAAEALNVARTGRLFLRRAAALLLGDGAGGNR
jgi:hypothetical protein